MVEEEEYHSEDIIYIFRARRKSQSGELMALEKNLDLGMYIIQTQRSTVFLKAKQK